MKQQNSASGIRGWMQQMWQALRSNKGSDDPLLQATDRVVEIADPVIRQARRYRQVLREPIAGSMAYFRSLSDVLPGPVMLRPDRYYDDPMVTALFGSPGELEEVLRYNPAINRYRKQGYVGEVQALMTMEQNERTIFGQKQEGELLLRDVRQQAVSFSDHRIVAIGPDLETTKAGIVDRGLEVLATVAMERITTLRAHKAELQGKKEYLQGMVKILGGKSHRQGMFAGPSVKNREELRKVEQLLAEVAQELEELYNRIIPPEHSLGHLESVMLEPEKMLTARTQTLRLDWKGVRVDDLPGSEGNEITLAEFAIEDVRRSAVLVTFSVTATVDA
ncbi:MAG: hypothetical protein AB7U29_01525 [Desulfobulbus sp.]